MKQQPEFKTQNGQLTIWASADETTVRLPISCKTVWRIVIREFAFHRGSSGSQGHRPDIARCRRSSLPSTGRDTQRDKQPCCSQTQRSETIDSCQLSSRPLLRTAGGGRRRWREPTQVEPHKTNYYFQHLLLPELSFFVPAVGGQRQGDAVDELLVHRRATKQTTICTDIAII